MTADFKKYFEDEENKVEDISNRKIIYLFILESPHTKELDNKCPVSGPSGEYMAKIINSKIGNFGIFVRDEIEVPIGIMNVSQVPLQKTQSNVQKEIKDDLIKKFKIIRENYKAMGKHREKECNEIEGKILADFKKRFKRINDENPNMKVIACGKFAQCYVEMVENKSSFELLKLPHPARNGWSGLEKCQIFKEVSSLINDYIN